MPTFPVTTDIESERSTLGVTIVTDEVRGRKTRQMQSTFHNIDTLDNGTRLKSQAIYATIIIYTLCIFAIDLTLKLGIAAGVPYLFSVWIAYRAPRTSTIWITALACSALTIIGAFLPLASDNFSAVVVINRMLALFAIWITAILCRQVRITRDALTKREQQVRQIIESAPTAMLMTDTDGKIVLTNAQTLRLFGYENGDLIGRSVDILVPESVRLKHPFLRTEYISNPTSRHLGVGRDLHGLRKDGREVAVEIGLTPIIDHDRLYILSAISDLSARKALEDALRTMNDDLEREVGQRTEELVSANEALVRSNIELQQFAYIASHDLQTPLRGISGFVQLLQREYTDKLDQQAHEWIHRTVENTQRMHTLINDLLAYSRVDSRARPFEPVDLNKIVEETVRMLEPDLKDPVNTVAHDLLPTVMGEPSQLVQLFENLIGNGIKYNINAQPHVHISVVQDSKNWVISVQDNGIGIDPKQHERIFEIFKRLHTTQTYPGTGIGLAVCRRVVHRHGGKIWLTSEPGQGTTFFFSIPIKEA